MDARELERYLYVKRPLHEVYPNITDVPEAFWMDWLKDVLDSQRFHSDEELLTLMALPPEGVLAWLEEAARLTWEAKKIFFGGQSPPRQLVSKVK